MTLITNEAAHASDAPLHTNQISAGETLLLGLFRRWVLGALSHNPAHWERLWRDISEQVGVGRAQVVVAAMEEWLCALAKGSSRPIAYHPPCCTVVSPDENQLLRLVTLGQAGDRAAAMRIGAGFVDAPSAADRLAGAASDLGDALLGAGVVLGARQPQTAIGTSRPTPLDATLH